MNSSSRDAILSIALLLAVSAPAFCWQDSSQEQPVLNANRPTGQPNPDQSNSNFVSRTTQAINYRQGTTNDVELRPTALIPDAKGKAKVQTRSGGSDIEARVEKLRPANTFGLAYLTYVLWGISPQGQPTNLGELVVDKDGKAMLKTTTPLQAFAMILTAEPDFAVSIPSEQVVLENYADPKLKGWVRSIDVSYHLVPRSQYQEQVQPIEKGVYGTTTKDPLILLQARNAVRIAKDAQAAEYAATALQQAQQQLDRAEDYNTRKQNKNAITTVAREAVQSAEAARVIAIRAQNQARIDREQREAHDREAAAQAAAEAQAIAAQKSQAEAQLAQQKAQNEALQRQLADAQAAKAQAEAQHAQSQAEQAQMQAQQAQAQAEQAEAARHQMRERLLTQLSQVMETKDTPKGLVVTIPDVLFAVNSSQLKTESRERLARVAGVLLGYPDIHVEVDGYTDSTGSPAYNQKLSQQRADSVLNYLVSQSVPTASITAKGFGQDNPVAPNTTAAGRQQNRRVELVVSGDSIGSVLGEGGGATTPR